MDKILQISVRNSGLKITKEKRAFLTYPADGLAACTLEELEDGISLFFNTEGLEQSEKIRSKSREQQLRFLINCANLESLYDEYDFSMSTDNLLVDINLRPQVLLRDIKSGRAGTGMGDGAGSVGGNGENNGISIRNINGQRFLPKYMALIGSFLLRKYKYEDFEKGGDSLYKKDKLTLELSEMKCTEDVKNRLIKEYHKTVNKIAQTKHLVPKRNAIISRIAIPVLTLSLLAASFFAAMALLYDIPYRNSVIMANEAYIAGSHLDVQRALAGFHVQDLSHETKHILSRSYVATEPLSDAQRTNILMGLALITDTSIFDYWIHLGRLEFDDAIDIAQRFGDNELLLFAYIRQEAVVRADPHMSGSEKVTALSYIEDRINALLRDRESAEELITGEADGISEPNGINQADEDNKGIEADSEDIDDSDAGDAYGEDEPDTDTGDDD